MKNNNNKILCKVSNHSRRQSVSEHTRKLSKTMSKGRGTFLSFFYHEFLNYSAVFHVLIRTLLRTFIDGVNVLPTVNYNFQQYKGAVYTS